MPGMLQLEAITQISTLSVLTLPNNMKKTMYIVSMNNIRFYKKFYQDKNLIFKIEYSENYFQFKGYIKVKESLFAKLILLCY